MKRMMIATAVALAWIGLNRADRAEAHEGHEGHDEKAETTEHHDHEHAGGAEAATPITVTGEIVDLACYIGHGASGEEHRECAETCIKSGLPVGLKTKDGVTYLLIGEHKPLNEKLAPLAAKTVTVRGKLEQRDGMHMIANAEIVE